MVVIIVIKALRGKKIVVLFPPEVTTSTQNAGKRRWPGLVPRTRFVAFV